MTVLDLLDARGFVQQCTDREALAAALAEGPLTVYVGVDPTADSMHVGHLLPLMAARWLQQAGCRIIALVGGGTVRVGDPSGRTEMRELIDDATIARNTAAIRAQLERVLVLDGERGLLVDNADWLLELDYIPFLRDIGRHFSVNRMLGFEAYKARMERGLSFIEFNYMLLQSYDFLELFRRHGCRLQIGGDDQWANIIQGADLIRRVEGEAAWGLTQPLLTTASGAKMGKTAKGALWLDAARTSPFDFWQYWVNVDDRDVGRLLKLYTALPLDRIAALEALEGQAINEAKRVLADEVTTLVHGAEAADKARAGAAAMVAGAAAGELPTHTVSAEALAAGLLVVDVLADAGVVASRSEGRRMVKQGAVKLDGDKVTSGTAPMPAKLGDGVVLRVGKRRAVRVVLG